MLELTDSIDNLGQIRWQLLLCLILAWIVVFLCLIKGIKSIGKVSGQFSGVIIYFTTKGLHDQYMVSSGHYRWMYCPLVPEGIIKFSVMLAGMKFRFSHELLHQFS